MIDDAMKLVPSTDSWSRIPGLVGDMTAGGEDLGKCGAGVRVGTRKSLDPTTPLPFRRQKSGVGVLLQTGEREGKRSHDRVCAVQPGCRESNMQALTLGRFSARSAPTLVLSFFPFFPLALIAVSHSIPENLSSFVFQLSEVFKDDKFLKRRSRHLRDGGREGVSGGKAAGCIT